MVGLTMIVALIIAVRHRRYKTDVTALETRA